MPSSNHPPPTFLARATARRWCRLCIFATVALLGWLLGPLALLFFAGLGFAGYWRARRAGLTRSKCVLRDTRLVLAYLGGLAVLAGWGSWQLIAGWLG